MTEMLDVYDANGKLIGMADRNVVHAFGLWHKTVHCWVVLDDGRLVFQRRAANMTNGGKLYTTASGHISSGETLEQAFVREISQEVGLDIDIKSARLIMDGVYVFDKKMPDGTTFVDRVFPNVFFAKYSGDISSFKFSDGEVSSVVAVNMDDYLALANGGVDEIGGLDFDGESARDVILDKDAFLLVGKDTLYSKFGTVCDAIKRVL